MELAESLLKRPIFWAGEKCGTILAYVGRSSYEIYWPNRKSSVIVQTKLERKLATKLSPIKVPLYEYNAGIRKRPEANDSRIVGSKRKRRDCLVDSASLVWVADGRNPLKVRKKRRQRVHFYYISIISWFLTKDQERIPHQCYGCIRRLNYMNNHRRLLCLCVALYELRSWEAVVQSTRMTRMQGWEGSLCTGRTTRKFGFLAGQYNHVQLLSNIVEYKKFHRRRSLWAMGQAQRPSLLPLSLRGRQITLLVADYRTKPYSSSLYTHYMLRFPVLLLTGPVW